MTGKDKKTTEEDSMEEIESGAAGRRRLLKGLAAGSAAITGQQVLPKEWGKPLVDAVILPAHAATSAPAGDRGALADDFPDTGGGADGDPANDNDFTNPQDGGDGGTDDIVDSDTDRDGDQDETAGDGSDNF